ncbi:MAG: ABC transporter permease [Armatimonadota bacterium]|nr:ABC transporter permease [Armatimonadota bacterium]
MQTYLVRRLIIAAVLLWVVASVVFFSVYLLPGDPAHLILGGMDANPTPEQLEVVREKLGLNRSVFVRYLEWLASVARGDFGRSLITDRSVAADLATRLLRTLQLIVPAILTATTIGTVAGVFAARRRGTVYDPLASAFTLLGFSVPVFVIGPILVYVFALWLRVLPSGGYADVDDSLGRFVAHLVLPALALAAAPMATTMRMTRSAVLEQLPLDYVRTARSKGLGDGAVIGRHVLRNAYLPVLTVLGLQVGAMFAGSVIVEAIFNWPGMNTYLLQAIGLRDYPVIQAVVLVASAIFITVNFLTDAGYALLDPRIRYG